MFFLTTLLLVTTWKSVYCFGARCPKASELHTTVSAQGMLASEASVMFVSARFRTEFVDMFAHMALHTRLLCGRGFPAISASIEFVVTFCEACQLLVLQALNTVNFRLVLFPVLPAISASIESVVRLVSMVEACQLLVLQALNTVLFRLVFFPGLCVLWCASRTFNELRWEPTESQLDAKLAQASPFSRQDTPR